MKILTHSHFVCCRTDGTGQAGGSRISPVLLQLHKKQSNVVPVHIIKTVAVFILNLDTRRRMLDIFALQPLYLRLRSSWFGLSIEQKAGQTPEQLLKLWKQNNLLTLSGVKPWCLCLPQNARLLKECYAWDITCRFRCILHIFPNLSTYLRTFFYLSTWQQSSFFGSPLDGLKKIMIRNILFFFRTRNLYTGYWRAVIYGKAKFALEQAMKSQRGSRGIVLLFL